MESRNSPAIEASLSLSSAFSVPLPPEQAASAPSQEDEEWEYEYSTSETETFYLTVDLTTPNTPSLRRRPVRKRGPTSGYKIKWLTAEIDKKKRPKLHHPSTISKKGLVSKETNPSTPTDGGDEDGLEPENDSDDGEEQDVEGKEDEEQDGGDQPANEEQANGKRLSNDDLLGPDSSKRPLAAEDAEPAKELDKIQILGLHSDNPIISYRNHTFSCSWAENIGTEFLFTNRDPNNTLPALRSLPGDVDLLAATSARLISTSATLVPKDRPRENRPPEQLVPRRTSFVLPIGHGAGPARKKQGSFLERMQDIKQRKNEPDEVTVFASKRQTNKDWYNEIKSNWKQERTEIQKNMNKGKMSREEGLLKLDEISRMEMQLEGHPANKSARGKRKRSSIEDDAAGPPKRVRGAARGNRRARSRGRRGRGTRGRGTRTLDTVSESPEADDIQGTISTPTPQTWDELERKKETNHSAEDTPMPE